MTKDKRNKTLLLKSRLSIWFCSVTADIAQVI